ncbi:AraC family transcriptional regulator [Arcicella rigui]|uniref:AraC family transcriptional regulator n=1 Tax=Arcicella rigui TaxID=797020 RepID=A0ABU5Q4Z4_9BACT|nr:AraC family transcriptional regulator [Arcicella rigui]MEA5137683.1 AraC family transcriptional regulator [Arcicella rigui]
MRNPLNKSIESPNHSFTIKELKEPYFDPNWHFHPHYQLFVVLEGTGTRFIGDNIKHFEAGDMVFVGPDLPHLWRSDEVYFQGNPAFTTHGIVVYFTEDFLGKDFFEKYEMTKLKHLFLNASRGLEISGVLHDKILIYMKELLLLQGFEAILKLLEMLNLLANSNEYDFISSLGYTNPFKTSETERMHKVHEYVLNNYRTSINLTEVASLAGMATAAFCRYFKARTNKTFSDFVSELRVGYACKLLMEDKLSVTQVCYESGFNTLSNFNKQFKDLKGQTPSQFRVAFGDTSFKKSPQS